MASRLLVLAWHNARATPFFPAPAGATKRGLARQLAALRRSCRVLALEQAAADLAAGRPLPSRATALTFDDGYRDNLDDVAPLLRHHGLPATFYLVPGLLDRLERPWWETLAWSFARAREDAVEWRGRRLAAGPGPEARAAMLDVAETVKAMPRSERNAAVDELGRGLRPTGSVDEVSELFLDWEGARRLRAVQTVGSHSMAHVILSQEAPSAQTSDLRDSRTRLQRELDASVDSLAYPNGTERDFDAVTVAAARKAGYSSAVTTLPGWNDMATPGFELRRFVMDPVRGLQAFRSIVKSARAPWLVGRR